MTRFVPPAIFLFLSLSTVSAQSIVADPDTLIFRGDTTEVKSFLLTFANVGNVTLTPPSGIGVSSYVGDTWPTQLTLAGYTTYSRLIYIRFQLGAPWGKLRITCPTETLYVTLGDANSLPVQLISFAGAYNATNNAVQLAWKTISETNNYAFEVQRKSAGESDFASLPDGFIPGHGTTLEPKEYSFIDVHIGFGRSLYRLKQIDLDNTVHFTDPIVVEVLTGVDEDNRKPTRMSLDQNFPNPFNPSTTIRYGLPHKSNVTLTVNNTLGQQVAVLQNGEQETGFHEVKFNGKDLSSGVYYYRIQAGSFVETRKLLLVK
jgi:hypothetical protein